MLGIEAIHEEGISDQDQNESNNRALLRHPESKWRITDTGKVHIQPISQQDATSKTNRKPDSKEDQSQLATSSPMSAGVIFRHSRVSKSSNDSFELIALMASEENRLKIGYLTDQNAEPKPE